MHLMDISFHLTSVSRGGGGGGGGGGAFFLALDAKISGEFRMIISRLFFFLFFFSFFSF